MAYDHFNFDEHRKRKDPLTQEEYDLMKNDYEEFMKPFFDNIETNKEIQNPPVKINWPLYIVAVLASILMLVISRAYSSASWSIWLFVFGLMFGVGVLYTPFKTLFIEKGWSNLEYDLKTGIIKAYFEHHHPLVEASVDYNEYLEKLK